MGSPVCYSGADIMDSEWLNRVGILAEAVSFLLIAPEIIGIERLQRVERVMEAWGRRTLLAPTKTWTEARAASTGPLRLLPDRPAPRERSGLWEMGSDLGYLLEMSLVIVLLGLFSPFPYAIHAFFIASMLSFASGTVVVIFGDEWYTKSSVSGGRFRSRFVSLAIWVLAIVGMPTHWMRALSSTIGYLIVHGIVSASVRLLSGVDRLRAFVFGTGVLLLFGGMATQFAATF